MTVKTIENKTAYFNLFIKPTMAHDKKMDKAVRENPVAIYDAIQAVVKAKAAKDAYDGRGKNAVYREALGAYGFLADNANRSHSNALVKLNEYGLNTEAKIVSALSQIKTQCKSPIGFMSAWKDHLAKTEKAENASTETETENDKAETETAKKRTKAEFMAWVLRQYNTEFGGDFFDFIMTEEAAKGEAIYKAELKKASGK